ncbi:MAG: hypothetical protein J5963_08840 [Schwartzia sp.]|nr:hypothetical protein [Schwartzia sp. (in: firmicutes)]
MVQIGIAGEEFCDVAGQRFAYGEETRIVRLGVVLVDGGFCALVFGAVCLIRFLGGDVCSVSRGSFLTAFVGGGSVAASGVLSGVFSSGGRKTHRLTEIMTFTSIDSSMVYIIIFGAKNQFSCQQKTRPEAIVLNRS